MTPEQLAAFRRILQFRWKSRNYEQSNCTSCGALRSVDYGDNDIPMTEKREPCSKTCPWAIAEAYIDSVELALEECTGDETV